MNKLQIFILKKIFKAALAPIFFRNGIKTIQKLLQEALQERFQEDSFISLENYTKELYRESMEEMRKSNHQTGRTS